MRRLHQDSEGCEGRKSVPTYIICTKKNEMIKDCLMNYSFVEHYPKVFVRWAAV